MEEVRWVVCRKSVAFSGVESSFSMPLISSAAYWSAAWEIGLGGQAVRKGVSVVMGVCSKLWRFLVAEDLFVKGVCNYLSHTIPSPSPSRADGTIAFG